MRVTHINILHVPIHKKHIHAFLTYGGIILIIFDATWAIIGPHTFHLIQEHIFSQYEIMFTNCGKTGAAMNALVMAFEKWLRT